MDAEARWSATQDRIREACETAGRAPAEVGVVAVSKKQSVEAIRALAEAGATVFGENRVQEAEAKMPDCPGALRWHLVGHLQRNKARRAVELFETIHSVDSERLLQSLEQAAAESGRELEVFLQVNVSGEASKFGLDPEEVPAVIESALGCIHLNVTGLMTIPPWSEDPEKARPYFAHLRQLQDDWESALEVHLPNLSMGMSHDLEPAVEEGADWVRIGTDLFGPRS